MEATRDRSRSPLEVSAQRETRCVSQSSNTREDLPRFTRRSKLVNPDLCYEYNHVHVVKPAPSTDVSAPPGSSDDTIDGYSRNLGTHCVTYGPNYISAHIQHNYFPVHFDYNHSSHRQHVIADVRPLEKVADTADKHSHTDTSTHSREHHQRMIKHTDNSNTTGDRIPPTNLMYRYGADIAAVDPRFGNFPTTSDTNIKHHYVTHHDMATRSQVSQQGHGQGHGDQIQRYSKFETERSQSDQVPRELGSLLPTPNVSLPTSDPLPANRRKLSSSSTNSSKLENDMETLLRKQKNIDYCKGSEAYSKYTKLIPKELRSKRDPRTPDKYKRVSRRYWDAAVKSWKISIHRRLEELEA